MSTTKKNLPLSDDELLKIEQENIKAGNEITGSNDKIRAVDDKLMGDDRDLQRAGEREEEDDEERKDCGENRY